MKIDWKAVQDILDSGDAGLINQETLRIVQLLENNLKTILDRGQLIIFPCMMVNTIGWSKIKELKKEISPQIAQFQYDIASKIAKIHGVALYHDVQAIQSGDYISVLWKAKKEYGSSEYKVLEKQGDKLTVSLSMWEHDKVQFDAHKLTIQINQKELIIGARQIGLTKNPNAHRFFFFTYN